MSMDGRISEEAVSVVGIASPISAGAKPAEAKAELLWREAEAKAEPWKQQAEVKIGFRADLEDVRARVKNLLVKVLSLGLNTPLNSVFAGIMKKTGLVDEKWVQYTSIQVENSLFKEFFLKVPRSERVLFIPHCMRDAKNCIAPIDEDGYHCKKCGRCPIAKITEEAERLGIKWYMCGGGSQVVNIIQREKPKAIIGIACYNEIQMALEKLRTANIPIKAVMLKKSGCLNTEVDLDEVFAALNS